MPATRAFSRQLVAYIAAFLPTAPYFKSNDGRISSVRYDQHSSTFAMLEETADEVFKVYMTRKTQGWFRRWDSNWECPLPSDAAASPGPGAAPNGAGSGAGAATPARPSAVPALAASDDEDASDLITGGRGATTNRHRQPWTWRRCNPRAGRRAHAIHDLLSKPLCAIKKPFL